MIEQLIIYYQLYVVRFLKKAYTNVSRGRSHGVTGIFTTIIPSYIHYKYKKHFRMKKTSLEFIAKLITIWVFANQTSYSYIISKIVNS